jgi:O-antigen/teichoic acid export membrane protein
MFSVVGVLSASAVFAIVFAYVCSTFLLAQFDVHRRMLVGQRSLLIIIASHIVSLILLLMVGFALLNLSGRDLQMPATLIAVGAQAIWLVRHLWLYRRDHLRVRRESYDSYDSYQNQDYPVA